MNLPRRQFLAGLGLAPVQLLSQPPQEKQSPIYLLDQFPIAGFQYHQGMSRRRELTRGKLVSLHAEPENLYDDHAVRIEYRGGHIGYVPRQRNRTIFHLLTQDAPIDGLVVAADPLAPTWDAVEIAVFLRL